MKLIQKHLVHGTQEFELRDDSVRVSIRSLVKRKDLDVELAILNPQPVVNGNRLEFHSRVKCGPLLSFYLDKPNKASFEQFIEALKAKAQAEFNAFAGLKG